MVYAGRAPQREMAKVSLLAPMPSSRN
jgi:hypothetical protein